MDTNELREAVRRRPFQPFTLRMNDGREFRVPHLEYVAVSKRMVVVPDPVTEVFVRVEPLLIASVQPDTPAPQSSAETNP